MAETDGVYVQPHSDDYFTCQRILNDELVMPVAGHGPLP